MLNPLRLPRVLKDAVEAMQAALPHAKAAADANGEMLELVLKLRDPRSGLGDAERAATQRRIDLLMEQMRSENEAATRPYEDLKTRHPDWIE